VHGRLSCGIEYAVMPLPQRHVVSFQMRMLGGTCVEPADKLGLARLVTETIDKGTEHHTAREISDAFDAIGALHASGTGRETATFSCTVLPDYFERAIDLHAEILRSATFPEEAFTINVELARQEIKALEDDPQSLTDKHLARLAFGPVLGRHALGEPETLDAIRRDDLAAFWRNNFCGGRMLVTVAGAIDPTQATETLEQCFAEFGASAPAARQPIPVQSTLKRAHHQKELQQEQIGICWPGAAATDDDYYPQQVMLGILSGGMSGRLFTEVREKQGLVYWVGAWQETPRGGGMIFLGASTTPERCNRTYQTLLREVDRLAEDLEQEELDRAVTIIVASTQTRGDSTRSRCAELASDLFHYGKPIPMEQKVARLQAVTMDEVKRYLVNHPRDRLGVVTLGPRALEA